MSKEAPYVVFGSGKISRKGLICYPSNRTGGWAAKVVQLKDGAEAAKPGEKFDIAEIDGEYFTMYFCNKSSLIQFIGTLMDALGEWEKGGKPDEAD